MILDYAENIFGKMNQQLNLDVPDMGGDTLNKTIALHGQYDPDFVEYKSFAHARREDAATVDGGMSSEGISQGVPTGYVHIEAPLSRSTSALGRSDETAAGMSANAAGATSGQQTTTETTIVKETFERNVPHAAGNASYVNHEDVTKNTMYAYPAKSQSRNEQTRSKSVLNEIDEEELRKPIQLNEIANSNINGGVSQIGATLIRPETPGGQGYVQNIISGSEPNFRENSMALNEYSNYEGAYLQDPTRSNLAFQNEIIMNDVGRPISYYDEQTLRQSNIPLYTNDIGMMNMNRNADRRQESSYVEHIEETRFL
ncbi:hypothetical protein HELRODRAFT_189058 [Helobdella robusta]|uniref:Uncharacterized protein n=1 Tax=Helobdella robusta TaxID=6412 RepID=T1FQL6_HELRO|nr:hypothetical protein HELRODRAFT_189058 [Helobdella robusta]ESN99346.1 hypothetical protein HELRODRAFT_189058 [Helobdella robusta]